MDYINLTDEQLVSLAQEKDTEAMSTVINRYKNLVKKVARSYFLIGGDTEDLLQEGMLGVFKAVETFNGKSGFKSYVYICVKTSIISAIKKSNCDKNKPLNNYVSISGNKDSDADKNQFVISLESDPETDFINKEAEVELQNKIKSTLSNLEFNILSLFLKGYSYIEIGEKLNKNAKSIDNALQRIRKKLKD